jgi:hypothetical protein
MITPFLYLLKLADAYFTLLLSDFICHMRQHCGCICTKLCGAGKINQVIKDQMYNKRESIHNMTKITQGLRLRERRSSSSSGLAMKIELAPLPYSYVNVANQMIEGTEMEPDDCATIVLKSHKARTHSIAASLPPQRNHAIPLLKPLSKPAQRKHAITLTFLTPRSKGMRPCL